MNKQKSNLVKLILNSIGWFLLSVLIAVILCAIICLLISIWSSTPPETLVSFGGFVLIFIGTTLCLIGLAVLIGWLIAYEGKIKP